MNGLINISLKLNIRWYHCNSLRYESILDQWDAMIDSLTWSVRCYDWLIDLISEMLWLTHWLDQWDDLIDSLTWSVRCSDWLIDLISEMLWLTPSDGRLLARSVLDIDRLETLSQLWSQNFALGRVSINFGKRSLAVELYIQLAGSLKCPVWGANLQKSFCLSHDLLI